MAPSTPVCVAYIVMAPSTPVCMAYIVMAPSTPVCMAYIVMAPSTPVFVPISASMRAGGPARLCVGVRAGGRASKRACVCVCRSGVHACVHAHSGTPAPHVVLPCSYMRASVYVAHVRSDVDWQKKRTPKLAAAAQCQHQARQAAPRNTQGRAVG